MGGGEGGFVGLVYWGLGFLCGASSAGFGRSRLVVLCLQAVYGTLLALGQALLRNGINDGRPYMLHVRSPMQGREVARQRWNSEEDSGFGELLKGLGCRVFPKP